MKWRHYLGPIILILVVAWACSSCSYNGSYRYPCQDPANWKSPDCEPPICVASGTCTRDLIYERTPNA
jgi:hypothetical protein